MSFFSGFRDTFNYKEVEKYIAKYIAAHGAKPLVPNLQDARQSLDALYIKYGQSNDSDFETLAQFLNSLD